MTRPLLALVLHANQYLIARSYGNREGIDELAEGYGRVLAWHEELGVPVNLHLSGTLIEAAAWFRPGLLARIRRLVERGVAELVGGTYGENVMPLFPPELNRRQCREHLWLLRRHLKTVRPRAFWVPERVWDTAALAPVIADSRLPNGGYRQVILDDRHLGLAPGAAGYWRAVGRSWRIAGGGGLAVLPTPEPLRYRIPPRGAEEERALQELFREAGGAGSDGARLLVFADDFERLAGVGPWSPAHAPAYRRLLEWLSAGGGPRPVRLEEAVAAVPAGEERPLRRGAYRELEAWGAGPDYRGWWESAAWAEPRACLESSLRALLAAEAGRNGHHRPGDLSELAWKHLLATTYETAWHTGNGHGYEPAPWAVALAHQSRAVLDLLALDGALRSSREPAARPVPDGAGAGAGAWTLGGRSLHALLAPAHGGRVVLLAGRARERSVLLVGTPTDDWNWQREPYRFMESPANHPGALADRGREHDRHAVRSADGGAPGELVLENVEPESPLRGTRKRLRLDEAGGAVEVEYEVPAGAGEVVVDCGLAPDYLRLLRDGRRALVPFALGRRRGARAGEVAAWVELPGASDARFTRPRDEAGHTHAVAVRSPATPGSRRFHLRLGGGDA